MDYILKLKLFYHKSGFIEIGKFTEEECYCYTVAESCGKLRKVLDLLSRGSTANAWSFSLNVYSPDGQMWSIEKKPSDREKKVFSVVDSRDRNDQDPPTKMRKLQLINDIMEKIGKGV